MDFQHLWALGMKRYMPELLTCDEGRTFDIGTSGGKYVAPGAEPLGAPDWVWPRNRIPAESDSVGTIYCFHFLEHLAGNDAITFMREVERVLIDGRGVFNFVVPYFKADIAATNLDHKSGWCEDTFTNMVTEECYPFNVGGKWKLSVHFAHIHGMVSRNLVVIGQLAKRPPPPERAKEFYPQ